MTHSEREMWEVNIENAASRVESEYGADVATAAFARYGAHSFYDLSPVYYSEVFADLEMIASDN